MWYGLNKVANAIVKGVTDNPSYFFACENFEMFLEKLYTSKTTKMNKLSVNNFFSDY